MSRKFWKIIKLFSFAILALIGLVLIYFIVVIAINNSKNYSPILCDTLTVNKGRNAWLFSDENISIISWNIGYCGLGKNEDFFYEGGKKMRPDKEQYKEYLKGVFNTISKMDSVDLVLLQEVDFSSKRSYYTAQDSSIAKALSLYSNTKATNYLVPYVPFPIFNPMANVNSGIMTFSRYIPMWAHRISYPGSYSWPMNVFFLDRCFTISRFDLKNGKVLYIINTHNSAYSDAGDIRTTELIFLRSYLLNIYENGDYIIAGGDWNQNPPNFNPAEINTGDNVRLVGNSVSADFLPNGWRWIYDPKTPTNRDVNTNYQKGKTTTTIFDYFLCSPNIKINNVHTINNSFEFSDHNPIYLNFELTPDSACCDSTRVYSIMNERLEKEKNENRNSTRNKGASCCE